MTKCLQNDITFHVFTFHHTELQGAKRAYRQLATCSIW